jgi:hypothetical protein
MRQSPVGKDVNTEAEDLKVLKEVTRRQPVNIEHTEISYVL